MSREEKPTCLPPHPTLGLQIRLSLMDLGIPCFTSLRFPCLHKSSADNLHHASVVLGGTDERVHVWLGLASVQGRRACP